MYGGWLVQGDVVMLAMFDTMFEMFKHMWLITDLNDYKIIMLLAGSVFE